MKKVVAVVVTHNRKELLYECISSLMSLDNSGLFVMVVDNASTDGTYEYISEFAKSDRFCYCNTGENLGGAGGFNYGMKKALETDCDFVWIMDDDCIVRPDTLDKLLEADTSLNGEYGFLSSIAEWTDGSICNMNIQKTGLRSKIDDYSSPIVPIIMATFVSAFFKREIILETGLPIKEFFIWSDDLEYTRRISKKYPCFAVTNSRVTHKMHSNEKVNIATDSPERLFRYEYLYRNEVYVYRREGFKGKLYLFLRLCLHSVKVLFSKKRGRFSKIRIILSSARRGFKFKPQIEYIDGESK